MNVYESFDHKKGTLKVNFETMLDDLKTKGIESNTEIAIYAANEMALLSNLYGDPGFGEALRAVRNSIAIKMSIKVVETAELADQRMVGLVQGALMMGIKSLT